MPRTSMHQSQNLNQSQVGVRIRGNVVHHMTYKMLDVVEICHFAFTIDALSLAEDWAVLNTDTIHVAVRRHILINLYNYVLY